MQPVVSVMNAWSCIVISVFAILILSAIGALFQSGHHSMLDSNKDPQVKDGSAVAATVFTAVFVYAGFVVFCGLQALLHYRENRRGAIALS